MTTPPPWLLLALVCLTTGCRPANAVRPPTLVGPVTLIASGDTKGWLVPCGCTSNQSGGLLRRATYVEQVRQRSSVMLVDVGGAPGGTSPYDILRFEAILRGEVEMQIAAHNIGTAEAALGAQTLRDLQLRTAAPFISANLVDANNNLLHPPLQNVSIEGCQVAIIGVTSMKSSGAGIKVLEPKPAILKAIREARPQPDRVIVLAYLAEQELQELASQMPEVDAFIGGPTGQAIVPRQSGRSLLAAATNKGKFLVHLPLNPVQRDPAGEVIELGPSIADHERQTTNLKQFLAELAERDFTPPETSFAPAKSLGGETDRLTGSESCRECHTQEHQSWTESRHASAWQTLVEKEFHVDPYCQQCHTTGYGRPGGFQSMNDHAVLGGVGCESCHGPSDDHVRDSKVRTPWNARDRCASCHDHENSPHFQFDEYWQQILHGDSSL